MELLCNIQLRLFNNLTPDTVWHTVRYEHHDGGREDADADEEVGEPEGEDELVGDGAQLGRRQHGDDDESVAQLKDEGVS